MDLETEEGDRGEELVATAWKQYDRLRVFLDKLVHRLNAGEEVDGKDVKQVLSEHFKALNFTLEQEGKLADRRRTEAGIVHAYALDFDIARAEIGRRLARLRSASGAGGVSGQAEQPDDDGPAVDL